MKLPNFNLIIISLYERKYFQLLICAFENILQSRHSIVFQSLSSTLDLAKLYAAELILNRMGLQMWFHAIIDDKPKTSQDIFVMLKMYRQKVTRITKHAPIPYPDTVTSQIIINRLIFNSLFLASQK